MDSAGGWSDTLISWSEFILLHVLPIAVSQIYDWVREWQILVAALIMLIFFHAWTRAILRAARQAARETVHAETRGIDASLKLLRRQIEVKPEAPKPAAEPKATTEPASPIAVRREPQQPAAPDNRAAVERLRKAIRLALSTIPLSDEPLPRGSLRLYQAAIHALDDAGVASDRTSGGLEGRGVLEQIGAELSALKQSYPPQSCRQAWQSLVKVNTLAREFHDPPLTRAEAMAAGARATP
jgi:hypothetical protein